MAPPSAATATTILDRRGDICSNSGKSFSFGHDGGQDGGRGPKRPMPHISDLTDVPVGVDTFTPIEQALRKVESYLNQAEASRNFGRADMAFKDFLCATKIVDTIIKQNKNWPALHDMKKLRVQYDHVVGLVRTNLPLYEKIKADIEADNARTGVQPSVPPRTQKAGRASTPVARRPNGEPRTTGSDLADQIQGNGSGSSHGSPPLPRVRPVVHPKPQALAGKAIKPAVGAGAGAVKPSTVAASTGKSAQELAQRFANLRAAAPNMPVDGLGLQGAQGLPKQPRLDTSFNHGLPSLPKVPAAIYSPARGTVSSEAAELPSSTPRGIFSRTNSTAATSTTGRSVPSPSMASDCFTQTAATSITGISVPSPSMASDCFTLAQPFGGPASARKRASLALPKGNTISAQELVDLMQKGTKDITILIIDIRPRDDFDEGHIMSHATICIEPDILERENISAAQIGDSMVLNPGSELKAFERRRDFDLVVFYDDGSIEIPAVPQTRQEKAICGLYNALGIYDYDGEDNREPRLLQGGLQAWTSLMGNSSLQTSSSLVSTPTPQRPRSLLPSPMRGRPQSFVPRPIQNAEEAHRWQAVLTEKDAFAPVRSTDDFLRRYPAVGQIQESMTSPVSSQESLYSAVPPPPTRPAPALPRSSHSGLDDPEVKVQAMVATAAGPSASNVERLRPGLRNPGTNWCYANSSLQTLFATEGFSSDLYSGTWLTEYKVPKEQGELINHPQIMARCLQSLFYVMSEAKVPVLEATVLMKYIEHIHKKTLSAREAGDALGGVNQQDAQEFFGFILETLHDETNIRRNVKEPVQTAYDNDPRPILEHSQTFWETWTGCNQSMIDRYWRSILVTEATCSSPGCNNISRNFEASLVLPLSINGKKAGDSVRLEDMLQAWGDEEAVEGFTCPMCKAINRRRSRFRFARLPDRLVFQIKRFTMGEGKDTTTVRFPVRGLSLEPAFVEGEFPADERHFNPTDPYDLYAVITHKGDVILKGHYIAFVKDHFSKDKTDWLELNDSSVTRMKVGEGSANDETSKLYSSEDCGGAYMVFYRRRGT